MAQFVETHPTMQRTPARIQAMGPGSESVLVWTWHWQWGQTIWTGWGPKLGALTYWTITGWPEFVGPGGGGGGPPLLGLGTTNPPRITW